MCCSCNLFIALYRKEKMVCIEEILKIKGNGQLNIIAKVIPSSYSAIYEKWMKC